MIELSFQIKLSNFAKTFEGYQLVVISSHTSSHLPSLSHLLLLLRCVAFHCVLSIKQIEFGTKSVTQVDRDKCQLGTGEEAVWQKERERERAAQPVPIVSCLMSL